MGIFTAIGGLFKTVFGGGIPIVGDVVGMISDGIKAKRDLNKAIELAKIDRVTKLDTADIEWDQLMARNSGDSWKDEWLTVWVTIINFGIPTFAWLADVFRSPTPALQRLPELYTALSGLPDWLLYANGIVFAGSFGVKPAIKYFVKKREGVQQSDSNP